MFSASDVKELREKTGKRHYKNQKEIWKKPLIG